MEYRYVFTAFEQKQTVENSPVQCQNQYEYMDPDYDLSVQA